MIMLLLPTLLSSVLLAASGPRVEEKMPRLAVEIINKAAAGRTLVHLEDAIGPDARVVGRHRPQLAMLVTTLAAEECKHCDAVLARLQKVAKDTSAKRGMILAVFVGRRDAKSKVQAEHGDAPGSALIGFDGYGMVRRRLGLIAPGQSVLIDRNGRIIGRWERDLNAALKAFQSELSDR